MLERLLQLLAEGGVYNYRDLMERLSISPSLLEMALDDLARLGYLRSVDGTCEDRCRGCAFGNCSVMGSGRLWALTDKGAKASYHRVPQNPSTPTR